MSTHNIYFHGEIRKIFCGYPFYLELCIITLLPFFFFFFFLKMKNKYFNSFVPGVLKRILTKWHTFSFVSKYEPSEKI